MPYYPGTRVGGDPQGVNQPESVKEITNAEWNRPIADEEGNPLASPADAFAPGARPQPVLLASFIVGDPVEAGVFPLGTIPGASIILAAGYDVQETFVDDDDDSATIGISLEGEEFSEDIITAVAIDSEGDPWDQGVHQADDVAGLKVPVDAELTITTDGNDLEAGSLTVWVIYIPTLPDVEV